MLNPMQQPLTLAEKYTSRSAKHWCITPQPCRWPIIRKRTLSRKVLLALSAAKAANAHPAHPPSTEMTYHTNMYLASAPKGLHEAGLASAVCKAAGALNACSQPTSLPSCSWRCTHTRAQFRGNYVQRKHASANQRQLPVITRCIGSLNAIHWRSDGMKAMTPLETFLTECQHSMQT